MLKVYLAGWSQETAYRDLVINKYGHQIVAFDPMREIEAHIIDANKKQKYELITDTEMTKIVERDKAAITESDIVTAYIRQWSCGTIMEILYAWHNSIPVFVIDPDNKFRVDIWLKFHTSRFFDDIEPCFDFILSLG